MILDTLDQADRISALHPSFPAAFEFLKNQRLNELDDGEYTIDGDRIFAIIARSSSRGRSSSPLEAHRRYIDIQYVAAGHEVIGWRDLGRCREPRSPYDEAKDIIFFKDEPHTWVDLLPGFFALFFPGDAHAPLAGEGVVHKIVIKVAV